MKKQIIALTLVAFSSSVLANNEEDKNAGTCAMYLFVAHRLNLIGSEHGPNEALGLADKPARAAQYSRMYAEKIKANSTNNISVEHLIKEGVISCYAIGLKLTQ